MKMKKDIYDWHKSKYNEHEKIYERYITKGINKGINYISVQKDYIS